MPENIIVVNDLKKIFRVHEKNGTGLGASLQLLFNRKYKYITAVNGINLKIKKGEIRGLIGPNGAGKSTIIKVISGILFPTGGTVEAMGYVPWLQRKEYVKNIGVVLGQKTQLLWDLPATDTFSLHKEIYKIPEQKYKANLDYFQNVLQIEAVIKKPVRTLSLGERMKCELVCALLHEPELVYLDEPTIGLDLFAKEAFRHYIKKINRERGTTFILTTHDLDEIENLSDNITIINHGAIIYDGSVDKLFAVFANRKTIEVKFLSRLNHDVLNGFKVVEFDSISAKIEVDLGECNIQDEVYKILKTLPVRDINIESICIEEVIKQIYNDPSGCL
ncbi:MAG: ATP-binding cassette domain-containing protein [Firmicutes bacterium]|nr:ATP-binding cassette domain-containing protein [Bacillota bacterium]